MQLRPEQQARRTGADDGFHGIGVEMPRLDTAREAEGVDVTAG
ncbi:MAG: hypothetical protein R2939_12850 [Kofleriaceae bacterium]